jgi:hypothetical protein
VSDSSESSSAAHFWRNVLRPAIRRGEIGCALCGQPLDRGDNPAIIIVVFNVRPPETRVLGIAVIIGRCCGDDNWRCFQPEKVKSQLEAAMAPPDAPPVGIHMTTFRTTQ